MLSRIHFPNPKNKLMSHVDRQLSPGPEDREVAMNGYANLPFQGDKLKL